MTRKTRSAALALAGGAIALLVAGAVGAVPPSYRTEVLADNPSGYWRLGEASGTVAFDETANHLNGAYKNGVGLGMPGAVATDTNTAAFFDGGNDRVEWTDLPGLDPRTNDFTIEGWVKTSVSPIDTER